jgi:hypothetical protein
LGLVGYLLRLVAQAKSLGREVNLLRDILQTEEAATGEGQDETVASMGAQRGEAGSEA